MNAWPVAWIDALAVFQELVFLADESETVTDCEQARRALHGLNGWGLELARLIPSGHGIVARVAEKLQEAGLLPAEDHNDGLILAEAALLNGAILLSGDATCAGWISGEPHGRSGHSI